MFDKKLREMEEKDHSEPKEIKENELDEAEIDETTNVDESAEVEEGIEKSSMEEELDSLLRELGMNEEEEEEGSDEVEAPEADIEGDDLEASDDEFEAPEGGMEGESEEVVDLTVDQLTAIIRNTIQDVIGGGAGDLGGDDFGAEDAGIEDLGGEEEFAGDVAGGDATLGDEGEEEVDLDELMAELSESDDDLDEAKVNGTLSNKSAKKTPFEKAKAGSGLTKKGITAGGKAKVVKLESFRNGVDESIADVATVAAGIAGIAATAGGITALMNYLKAKKPGAYDALSNAGKGASGGIRGGTTSMEESEAEAQLNEAIKVIKALKSNLNEVNLLNAKLLYVNKIFKSKSLTESQKVKVVSAFDKANTVKEAKTIFESLNEALSTTKKSPIRESFGLASKPVGSGAPNKKNVIVENSSVIRMQQLAGIKKLY
jgi:hypothetical protein